MFYWNPGVDSIEEWNPKSGWDTGFSEQDKLEMTNLFFFFKNKKGFKENTAEILANMVIFKQKYRGMQYTNEQEAYLNEALKPVFNS